MPWLWRKPVAFVCFATDILTPFGLYAVVGLAVAHALRGDTGTPGLPLALELPLVVPLRIAAFATMFHQGWSTRPDRADLSAVRSTLLLDEAA